MEKNLLSLVLLFFIDQMVTRAYTFIMKPIRNEHVLLWLMGISTLPFLYLFTKVDYSLLQTNTSLFWPSFLSVLANILGFIASLFFFWQLLIGTRHFTKYLTINTVWVNKLHRILGTYGIVFILAHPLLETWAYLKTIPWLFAFSFENTLEFHISFGRIALILFFVIWVTSAVLRKKMKFRPWKYIHYLSYPLMAFVFFHAFDIGTFLETEPFIRTVWFTMLLIYLVLVGLRLGIGGGLWKRAYELASIEHVGDSIIILRLKPKQLAIDPSRIGQYAYLQVSRFHEAHPFTIMDQDEKTGELIFGIRKIGSFTHSLEKLPIGSDLLVDGPYGAFTLEAQNESPRVVIAGGIGVTPFARLAKAYGKGMTFIHCNRTQNDIVWREQIKSSAEKYIDVLDESHDSPDANTLLGRLDIEKIKLILGEKQIHETPFFLCGSPMFVKIMKETLKKAGVPKERLYSEELGFL